MINPTQRINDQVQGMNEYQVLINLQSPYYPHNLRITYKDKSSGTICMIEELDAAESVKCSCSFKGRKKIGNGVTCQWMYEVKKSLSGMKPNHYVGSDILIDSHYKIH